MTNANRPVLNLDLDLLRTFVAVADLNTFAAAAVAVRRTQSAVSQQMQRLEQLIGKELFARHGRNKLLTEHGIQFLGYARKILQFNDEACTSLIYSDIQGTLTIGASDDTADTILPYILHRATSVFPKLSIAVSVKRSAEMLEMLHQGNIDLVITTMNSMEFPHVLLRTSPTLWYCAADYQFRPEEPVSLVVLDEPSPFRSLALEHLTAAGIPWRISYVASTLSAVRAAVKAGLGVTVRSVEMMSPELRVLGEEDGLPRLPETRYFLCKNPNHENELVTAIFNVIGSGNNAYVPTKGAALSRHGDDATPPDPSLKDAV
ncbi:MULTISPECIES: transcriptional regulator LrhA [unclassified Brenneria]|uniref:transcriptional regulator LrhA n=1 Tax=unclassified Brenneria TaxID=2634434 RepID=UPI00155446FE|nr:MULTISPECIES: transcriptional regulator LrhA [unclassified Brenneria]MBJ7221363.1 transcriptional regulator LrhA [Brenneria sp. L3-3C-1]MEE3642607.1 transcriptional regulator LrhA [Brenneria sp. L3_3C_1]MEE3650021.1 transcriptional regulator LrhA [Brenneria sp. HEZEL_4_2_4]NPC99979.1 transcriptional regulator LrhA [Brenneria sp. hezel4-2-4]